jgi:hypothetical protein
MLTRTNRYITFFNVPGIISYPKGTPLPRIGDKISLDGNYGEVYEVTHRHKRGGLTIEIRCKN